MSDSNFLELLPAVNFKSGKTPQPKIGYDLYLSMGGDPKALIPILSVGGFSFRLTSLSVSEFTVIVYDQTTTKDKVKTIKTVNEVVTFTYDPKLSVWSASNSQLIDSKTASKINAKIYDSLATMPLLVLENTGLFVGISTVDVLTSILDNQLNPVNTTAIFPRDQIALLAGEMVKVATSKPSLATQAPKQWVKYLENDALQSSRFEAYQDREDRKTLAAAETTDDQF